MATLQKIRSKGPLLVIVIGLALFAFIAGDAWKVMQPHQSRDVGEVNGEALSAQDFQTLADDYTEVVKMMQGVSSLTDEQSSQVRDQVWSTYVNNKLVEKEAKTLGLTVTDAEIQDILNKGTHPLLQQTPFRNPQTGRFDKDMLNKFLVEYAKMNPAQMPAQYVEQYDNMYKYWSFVQTTLKSSRLAEKYQALVSKALLSNPVEAQDAFDARVNQYDLLMAAIPYSTVPDSTVTVKESELKSLYEKKKEQFKQYQETRNIKYIDVQVTASPEDKAAIQKEVDESTDQLRNTTSDYTAFVRSSGSETPYTDLFYNKTALPSDVAARLDSIKSVGEVYGPYTSVTDNTINSFKLIAKAEKADSIQFRQIQVVAETAERTTALADSIFQALKGGADFAEVAMRYGQTGESSWMSSANYEGAQLDMDNLSYIKALTTTAPNVLTNLPLTQANIILQVTARRAVETKYKVAVVKREVAFSKETYSKAYNDFSQFIAANPTLDSLSANAEDAGYRLLDRSELYSSEHGIGSIRGTKDALRWVFSAKPGQVSGLYECGDSDYLLVVALTSIVKEGYRPMALMRDQLQMELLRDKKAEKLMAEVTAAGTAATIQQYKGMTGAVSDSVKYVTFSAPAFIPVLRNSEPMVSAFASVAETGKVSQPIKGNSGLLLLQQYATEQSSETYDQTVEENRLNQSHASQAGQFVNDLYLKAKVKDNRYLFF
jgi:peptidyl-prolyl cis-trans isomerase D